MEIGIYCSDSPFSSLTQNRIDAYLDTASKMGVELFFFNDSGVDIAGKYIIGITFNQGSWQSTRHRLPDIIINETGLTLRGFTETGKELRKEVTFNNYPISDFTRITKKIKEKQQYEEYVQNNLNDYAYYLDIHLLKDSSEEWQIMNSVILKNDGSYAKNYSHQYSSEIFGKEAPFYNFYLNNLSKDLATHINSFYKRNITELFLTFGVTNNKKFKLDNVTNYVPQVENEYVRTQTIFSYMLKTSYDQMLSKNITVGMLVKTKRNPSIFKNFNNMKFASACVAKMRGLNFFFFTSDDVNFEKKQINGYVYNQKGKLGRKMFSYPDVIIDRFRMRGLEQYKKLYEEFSDIPFNNDRIGGALSKAETYNIINRSENYREFLIPYKEVTDVQDILDFIRKYKKIILKPSVGSFGDDIVYIEEINLAKYYVQVDKEEKNLDENQLLAFLNQYADRPMVIQQFIVSQTKFGEPFDVRIHVLKDDEAKWQIANIYPRIGSADGVTSNLSGGGSTSTWAKFFRNEFPDISWKSFNKELMSFAKEFAEFFSKEIEGNINELAIDIGIDRETENVVFFEINANIPGARFHTLEAAFYIVSYAEQLVKEHRKKQLEKQNINDPQEIQSFSTS